MAILSKLNGWQRLWVVFTVLYGAGIFSFVIVNYPSRSDVVKPWAISVLEDWDNYMFSGTTDESNDRRELLTGLGDRIEVKLLVEVQKQAPTDILEREAFKTIEQVANLGLINDQLSEGKIFKNRMSSYIASYNHKISILKDERIQSALQGLAIWTVSSISILLLGYAFVWVKHGFKPH
jgi:hypothetical protein